MKYLGVPGDGDTLSITLAVPTRRRRPAGGAEPTRTASSGPAGCCPVPTSSSRDGPLEPRRRRATDGRAAQPDPRASSTPTASRTVLGFHAVGDAHTCTNPLYGRGCSLAVVQALLLTDAARRPSRRSRRRGPAPTRRPADREVVPSYDFAVEMDRMGADPARLGPATTGRRRPAARRWPRCSSPAPPIPVIGRGLARLWNLLTSPERPHGRPRVHGPDRRRSWPTPTPTRARRARARPAPSCSPRARPTDAIRRGAPA